MGNDYFNSSTSPLVLHSSCDTSFRSKLHLHLSLMKWSGDTPGCHQSYRVARTKYPDSEPEVPMLIVALAAAAVHFCLSEWATGSLHMVEFRGDKARPEYRNNMELLQKIQQVRQMYILILYD
ncbi:hypothetical protein BT96DRAFT_619325 [Gymnopus androsaceus JB14]|uniref:DUF6532 domain-containing protein n=1 Tax=Gymnopus androsaceus JB14 TaxID=1447944 RepID=A0A6A4HT21_9AGAR|nr:hypothetical protein BT96DRAFT_619325 [Gymnopus androsaceus JB14]